MSLLKQTLGVLLIVLPHYLMADVTLNAIFSDHMVVQRETEIPVWGWADAGENISIVASWGAKAEVITSANGTWIVNLKTPKAGGPFKITVSGKNTIEINDVLSGEVWLCTGQSNMDFAMVKFVNNAREKKYQPLVEYIKKEIEAANDDWLRQIEVPQKTSLFEKKTNFEGQWLSANAEGIEKISATGYFFAKELRKHLDVPIGLVECSLGGTRIQPWLSKETYFADEKMKAYFESGRKKIKKMIETVDAETFVDTSYQKKFAAWEESGKKTSRPYPKEHPAKNKQMPATLYNGMLSSVMPYAIKGVLWYQGEGNSHSLEEQYEDYFTALINSWRADWGQGDIPFYWMQLASYKVPDKRSDMGWAMVSDHLRRTLKLPNTGMAVLHDIGEAKDVHPHNKMDAGKRLSLWALKNDYGVHVPVVSGPLYKSKKVIDDKIEIEFNEVGSGLMVGFKELLNETVSVDDPLNWFEISTKEGTWKPAKAKIISKNKIIVWSSEVSNPVEVRYAWSSNPEGANLYNKEGLPAAIFSTEN